MNPNPTPEIAVIADGLTEAQRYAVFTLCGNAWEFWGAAPYEIADLNGLGLLHIDALKDRAGAAIRGKARPTELGLAVRNHLKETADER
jgi:hypothetical protein